jgi:peptidoglycan DL-endopeptidase CwlO
VRFSVRQLTTTLVVMLLALPVIGVLAPPASADAISDKRAQAAQIAARLDQLSNQIDQLGQQFDAAQDQLGRVNVGILAAAAELDRSKRQLDSARSELTSYAVEAYVHGSDSSVSDYVFTGSGPDVVRQVAFLQAASVDKTQLIDDVRAAEYTTHSQLATLHTAQASAKALQVQLAAEKDQATQAIGQQQALQATVTGELAQLVAQAQAAQAALAEQRAKARLVSTGPIASPGTGTRTGAPAAPGHGAPAPAPDASPADPPSTSSPGPVVPLPVPSGNPPPVLGASLHAIAIARQFIGTPYAWGGASPATGFDCSGLVQYSFGQAGVSLPRVADEQAAATRHITFAQAQAGDLVFFDSPDVGHVGIYLGGGMMLDAPHTGAFVRIEAIWSSSLVGFGRVV